MENFLEGFSLLSTVGLSEDIHFRNELRKRGTNTCLWVHGQCKIMIFKILAHCLFEKRWEIQFYRVNFFFIFEKNADFHRVKNGRCAGILKTMILHCLCTHKHGLVPLFRSSFRKWISAFKPTVTCVGFCFSVYVQQIKHVIY